MMPQHNYGPPPWATQAPQWAQPNAHYDYRPFIPPRPPPQEPPGWYQAPPPVWSPDYYAYHQSAHPPQEPEEDPTVTTSKKWPKLSAILASDTTLARFKISGNKPKQEILASTYYTYRNVPANATPTTHMRLFSKQFPWSIEINSRENITCSVVWDIIWATLQQPILESEWGMLAASGDAGKRKIEDIKEANKKRLGLNSFADKRFLRCDYLGENVWCLGLEKDDNFQALRILPGSDQAKTPLPEDTWLVKMGR